MTICPYLLAKNLVVDPIGSSTYVQVLILVCIAAYPGVNVVQENQVHLADMRRVLALPWIVWVLLRLSKRGGGALGMFTRKILAIWGYMFAVRAVLERIDGFNFPLFMMNNALVASTSYLDRDMVMFTIYACSFALGADETSLPLVVVFMSLVFVHRKELSALLQGLVSTGSSPWTIVLPTTECLLLPGEEYILGRHNLDPSGTHSQISRRHVLLEVFDDTVRCTCIGKNPLTINSTRQVAPGKRALCSPGDDIHVS
eukprot:CAMPEP_0203765948 /NCGR_PEP_ID=MMETSP0099_2-20121227/145_1 /ASSEMBLY_ACC=CAM_ASM_000209 /TAXON_ID=96639 /ORGANISM=" , Strain NY0313808BC1" /LENGTH=256 /DNA_ID=CAMNT_0050662243 /DNA_START=266 /DNA_END=1033 /DNA_ORIENTATION=-